MSELQTVKPNGEAVMPMEAKSEPVRKHLPKRIPEKLKVVKRKKPDSLKRSRVMRRKGARFEAFQSSDEQFKYAWAAYKRGVWKDAGIDQDMESTAFIAWLIQTISDMNESGAEAIFLSAPTKLGIIPVGMAFIEYHGNIAYPHVSWYPEASARNKLEIVVAFLIQLKKNNKVLVTVEKKDEKYFSHVCKYGVLRKVGKLLGWVGSENRTLFQAVGN